MHPPTAKRFTVAEYHQLTDWGFFQGGDRVELIRGELVYMAAKGTPHEVCLTKLLRILPQMVGDRVTLRCQSPIMLPDSEPEPDFSLLKNRADDYLNAHPAPADVLLVIEIADSSFSYDQDTKLSLYARDQIPHYWIFNLLDQGLETYSEPYPISSDRGGYRSKRVFMPHETLPLPGWPELILDLALVFPRR